MFALLSVLLLLPVAPPSLAAGATVAVTTSSATRELWLTTDADCPSDQADGVDCTVPATLFFRARGSVMEAQRLALESVVLFRNEQADPPRWEARAVALDVDFDGDEDLALADTQDGPYGATTYAIFVAGSRRDGGRLTLSEELSALTRENMGLFTVDTRRRRLLTSSKSGCCIHYRDEYAFVGRGSGGRGALTLVDHVEENAMFEDHAETIHGRLVGGVWRSVTRRTPLR